MKINLKAHYNLLLMPERSLKHTQEVLYGTKWMKVSKLRNRLQQKSVISYWDGIFA